MSEPHPGRQRPTVPRPSLHAEVEVIVFDVLGTLVDEPAGLRAGLRAVLPGRADEQLDELAADAEEPAAVGTLLQAGSTGSPSKWPVSRSTAS